MLMLVLVLIFAAIPMASAASSQTSVQITGQGNLVFSGLLHGGHLPYYGPEGSFKVTNSSGQVVFSDYRATNSDPGYFLFKVPNLPYDTYTITGTAETPNTSVEFYTPSF